MVETPNNEPAQVTAGDTISWTKTVDDFPAGDGWTLTYNLRGPSSSIDITAAGQADGSYLVSVSAATSANWTAERYRFKAFVSKDSSRYEVDEGRIVVAADFAELAIFDERSHAEITLANIKAVLEKKATRDQQSFTLPNGQSLERISVPDLLKFKDYYEREVANERNARRLKRGNRIGGVILTRFT